MAVVCYGNLQQGSSWSDRLQKTLELTAHEMTSFVLHSPWN